MSITGWLSFPMGEQGISTYNRKGMVRLKMGGGKSPGFIHLIKSMDKDRLIIFREELEKRKEEILREIENRRKFFPCGGRLQAGVTDNEAEMLREINEALERIRREIYGICEGCGMEILEGRLVVMPFTRLCVECKRKEEEK